VKPSWGKQFPALASVYDRTQSSLINGVLPDFDDQYDDDTAFGAKALLASIVRDVECIGRLVNENPNGAVLRPEIHFAVTWSVFTTMGVSGFLANPGFIDVRSPQELPTRWRQDLEQLQYWVSCLRTCKTPEISREFSIPLLDNQPIPIMRVRIAGEDLWFVLDTGAPTSVLSAVTARRLGIKFEGNPVRQSFDGSGNPIQLFAAVVDSISIGPIVFQEQPVNVASFSADLRVGGIVSPQDLFRQCGYEIDWRNRILTLKPSGSTLSAKASGAGSYPIQVFWQNNVPLLPGRFANGTHLLIADSGAGTNLIDLAIARQLNCDFDKLQPIVTTSLTHSVELLEGLQIDVSTPSLPHRDYPFMVRPEYEDAEGLLPKCDCGCLGVQWFDLGVWNATPYSTQVHFQPWAGKTRKPIIKL
jgi:hypothetical protein